MIALREAYQAGLLSPQHWPRNLMAGLIVGIVALPLSMAFAIASGARPEQGLYTAAIAGVIVTIFGGTRLQIAGPTGAFIAVLASVSAQHGMMGLQIATLMAGILLALMGILRLGGMVRRIPQSVITGMTAGIALIIFFGQWRNLFGISNTATPSEWVIQLHWPTVALGAISLLIITLSPRLKALSRIPGPLTALVLVTALHWALSTSHFTSVQTIGSVFGGIPIGLPSLNYPMLNMLRSLPELAALTNLIFPAISIALLGAIESLLSAVIADNMAGTHHEPDQELIGQGLANVVAPLFGGFAATGALARTATNIRQGGNSPIAGLMHVLTLIGILVFLAPLAARVPLCVLAAILIVVAWNMSEAQHVLAVLTKRAWRERLVLLLTFTLTVTLDLVIAVGAGCTLAALLQRREKIA